MPNRAVDVVAVDQQVAAEQMARSILRLDLEQIVGVLLRILRLTTQVGDLGPRAQDVDRFRVEAGGPVDEPPRLRVPAAVDTRERVVAEQVG